MDLGVTERVRLLVEAMPAMVEEEIAPLDVEYHAEVGAQASGDRFRHTDRQPDILGGLEARARERGLRYFWLTESEKRDDQDARRRRTSIKLLMKNTMASRVLASIRPTRRIAIESSRLIAPRKGMINARRISSVRTAAR